MRQQSSKECCRWRLTKLLERHNGQPTCFYQYLAECTRVLPRSEKVVESVIENQQLQYPIEKGRALVREAVNQCCFTAILEALIADAKLTG